MGGVRFLISALISKQISDFWTQISTDFTTQCTRFLLLSAPSGHLVTYFIGVLLLSITLTVKSSRPSSLSTSQSSLSTSLSISILTLALHYIRLPRATPTRSLICHAH